MTSLGDSPPLAFDVNVEAQGDIRLRRFPAPYGAMAAISSDIDRTSIHALRAMHRFINTETETPVGRGVGLDFGNSMWMYGSTGGGTGYAKILTRDASYWRNPREADAPSPVADELVAYAKAGWIDTLHTYGNFSTVSDLVPFTRPLAEKALEELTARDVKLTVWTNHGNRGNRQNIGASGWMQGDLPAANCYHADLLTAYGVRFLHTPVRENAIETGHADILTPTPLRDGQTMHGWPRYAASVGDPRVAARAHSMTGHAEIDPGGDWFTNVWNAGLLGEQLKRSVFDPLVEAGAFAVFGQHLGTFSPMSELDQPAVEALRLLRAYQDDGRILVARTSRLLRYAANRKAAHWRVRSADEGYVVEITRLDDSVEGPRAPTLADLEGLTFEAPIDVPIRLAICGRLVDEADIERTTSGRRTTTGIKWRMPDRSDWSVDFRGTDRHTSVSGYLLSDEDGMELDRLNAQAIAWLDDVAAEEFLAGDRQMQAAHKYTKGRYAVGLPHYGAVMERLGFTGRGAGLDIGSGAGHWALAYAAMNDSAVGLELRAEYVKLANGVSEAVGMWPKAKSVVGDACALPFKEGRFDTVWSHGVMMFVEHDRMMDEMNRTLAQSGVMYLAYTSLGHRLHVMCRLDPAAARVRAAALTIVFNAGLYRLGVYRTLRGRVRAYTREEIQQTARYSGFETLGAPGVQDHGARWGDVETTIDLIAWKRFAHGAMVASLAERAADDAALLAEAERATAFGAPEAAVRLLEISNAGERSREARRTYQAACLKAGKRETPDERPLMEFQESPTEADADLLARFAFNYGNWDEALEWIKRATPTVEARYLEIAALINRGDATEALAAAETAQTDHNGRLFARVALLKALEAAGEDDRLLDETARLADEIAKGEVDATRF